MELFSTGSTDKTTCKSTTHTKFTQKCLDFSTTPAAPPPHTYLKPNSGTSTLEQLLFHTANEERNSTNTPSRVHPGCQERKFPEWQKPSVYARPIYLRVSVDGQPPVPSQLHSDLTFHFEFLHISYTYLTIFSCKAWVTIPMQHRLNILTLSSILIVWYL